jgi:4a-hydroxytetrahydrobiopterin dehydratase
MTDFADRQCKPCEGGVPPLTRHAAVNAMAGIHTDWALSDDGKSIQRVFEFRVFSRSIAFTNAVAWIATVEGHHPEMIVSYGRVVVQYRTTAIDGLTENDFICAAKIDRLVATPKDPG